jgi:hypothetical protein
MLRCVLSSIFHVLMLAVEMISIALAGGHIVFFFSLADIGIPQFGNWMWVYVVLILYVFFFCLAPDLWRRLQEERTAARRSFSF